MADVIDMATCISAMDYVSFYISMPDGYPEDLKKQYDDAILVLKDRLWAKLDKDALDFAAAVHDGDRGAYAMKGAALTEYAQSCLDIVKRLDPK